VLCAVQAATVAMPARQARPFGRSWVWLAVPAALLAAGVLIINLVPEGPHVLARIATFGTPVLAATGGIFKGSRRWWLWPPVAVGLWFAAWLASGLVRDAAGTALVALACLAAASAIAMVAPAWSIRVGLVCLAALDIVLVWATPSVREASNTLIQVQSPVAAGTPLPSLQQPAFGSAYMGWLDLLAPALLGVVVAGRTKLGAAAVTGIAAGLWGLLFYVTSEVAATVPVLAGLAFAAFDARRRRLRHPLEPARAGGDPGGDRGGGT
jgi:heme exporter protein D